MTRIIGNSLKTAPNIDHVRIVQETHHNKVRNKEPGTGSIRWRPGLKFRRYRTDNNMIASTTAQPTMTREATAPAVTLSFCLVV